MRRYQRKLVNEVATLYQSNDPLKWAYIANRMKVTYVMSDRERRIMFRRAVKSFKDAAQYIGKVFGQVLTSVQEAVGALVSFANASGINAADIQRATIPRSVIDTNPKIVGGLKMPEMRGLSANKIIIDEYDGDDHEIRQ